MFYFSGSSNVTDSQSFRSKYRGSMANRLYSFYCIFSVHLLKKTKLGKLNRDFIPCFNDKYLPSLITVIS